MSAMAPEIVTPESGEAAAGIYIHIPYCLSKCDYCSFNSIPCLNPPGEYLTAVKKQAELFAGQEWTKTRSFASLFMGGGTPTIYPGEQLGKLVSHCRELFALPAEAEISVEANPNTVSLESLQNLHRAGVNRLSIGVQSFSTPLLQAIGRSHNREEALQAVSWARQAGFGNINIDLIFGLPGQTFADWQESLKTVLSLEPEHLALYELSVEEGTPFFSRQQAGNLSLPEDELLADMEGFARERLPGAGLAQYEVSNYARPGMECRHNINYWQNGSYLGLGAGAVSSLSGMRVKNIAEPDIFIDQINKGSQPFSEAECLPLAARFRETVIMGLRLNRGVPLSALSCRFGLTPQGYYGKILQELEAQGLIEVAGDCLRLTPAGQPVANQVLSRLV